MDESEIAARAVRACAEAARALQQAGVVPEGLAEFVPERRVLRVFRRGAAMRPIGEAWRLGSLLLGTDGALYSAGHATRAAERGRAGYQSLSREERRDIAAAALRGGYPVGAPVNYDAVPIALDGPGLRDAGGELPLGVRDGAVRVRWRQGAPLEGAPTLEQYLSERVELLIHPPLRAS